MKRLLIILILGITVTSCKKACEDCYIVNTKINDGGYYTVLAYQECGDGQKEFHDLNSFNQYNLGDYLKGTGCKYE